MSVATLEIIQPGMLTTIQDRGRYGYQRFGMPVAGAMDGFALRAANLLVGNDDSAAGLEITVLGPRIRLIADTCIAITGADVSPLLDEQPIPMWQSVYAAKGSIVTLRRPRDGMRAYLAVAGGIDVPAVMDSRSTYMKAAIGGLQGRALKAGDILNVLEPNPDSQHTHRQLSDKFIPRYGNEHCVRIVLGPQHSAFTQSGIETFLRSTYEVSIYSDRMGYRLEGPKIEHISSADVISDGTPLGAVQVPGDGQPIILLADRGTTGGYTKIATLISTDISKIAQAMPGNKVIFQAVSVEEAQAVLRSEQSVLNSIRDSGTTSQGSIGVVVNGEVFHILNKDGKPLALPRKSTGTEGAHRQQGKAHIGKGTFEFDITIRRLD